MSASRYARLAAESLAIAPLATSAVLTVFLSVAAFGLRLDMPLAYLLIGIAAWLAANYSFEILEHRATGGAGWAVFSADTMLRAERQAGTLFMLGAAALVLCADALLPPLAAPAATAVLLALAPAAAALLAVTRQPLRALNPLNAFRALVALGSDYVAVLVLTGAAAAAMLYSLRNWGPAEFFVACYAPLVVAYWLGAVVYDRRLALGVHAPRSPEARLEAAMRRLEAERERALDHAYGVAARGGVRNALDYLARFAHADPEPLETRLWLFRRMCEWRDGTAALEHGRALADELEAAGREREAAKVRLACEHLAQKLGSDA